VIIFDIETGPLPDAHLGMVCGPFKPPPPPGDAFDPATVARPKRWGDEAYQRKVDEAREAWEKIAKAYPKAVKQAREAWLAGLRDKAALRAETGEILAIGIDFGDDAPDEKSPLILMADSLEIRDDDDGVVTGEKALLLEFWAIVDLYSHCSWVGHNSNAFDLDFIAKRSAVHGVTYPEHLLLDGRWLASRWLDTMQRWHKVPGGGRIKLDTLAKLFGIEGKPAGVDGSMFADLVKTDRKAAIDYLKSDLRITREVAARMFFNDE